MTIRIGRLRTGAGRGSAAGLALGLLALIAAGEPSRAQELQETIRPPDGHQPLALAYLAAPYSGGPSGRAADFTSGKLPPGESIIARFLPRTGSIEPWDGIPFGLFKRTTTPGASTRLGVTGSALDIGGGRPLELKLYAFLSLEQLRSPLKLLTYESDAWKARQDAFSLLSDTTFVLTGALGTGGPGGPFSSSAPGGGGGGGGGGQRGNQAAGSDPGSGKGSGDLGKAPGAVQGRDNAPKGGPPYGAPKGPPYGGPKGPPYGFDPAPKPYPYAAGPKGPGGGKFDTGVAGQIACVNKRSTKDSRSLSCAEGTGEIIEDPLSGGPALLMYSVQGPPQWLSSVPTEICIEDGNKAPSVSVPFGSSYFPITLVDRKGKHLCTRAVMKLDYVSLRQSGIEIDGVKHRRLGSRNDRGTGWKMLAEPPSRGVSGSWTQRIVLVSPAPAPLAVAPSPKPAPSPDTRSTESDTPPATFSVVLNDYRWKLSLSRLWYGPLPPGSDSSQSFKCEAGSITIGTTRWTRDKLTEASAVSEGTVFKIPPGRRLDVTQPATKVQPVSKGLVLLAESSSGTAYCGIATPQAGSAELDGKLAKEPPPPPPPVFTADLGFQREGPAALIIEMVSQGKAAKVADLDAASLTKTVKFMTGDKIRVRPADPDFQGVSAVKVDGTAITIADDKSVEIELNEKMRTFAIKTALRPVSGFLTVATSQGAVEVVIGGGKTTFPPEAQPRKMFLRSGVKLGDEVTVEAKDPDRFSVVGLTLKRGGSSRSVQGASFKFERGDLPGGKLDLTLEVALKSNDLLLPVELVLKPVVHLGKRQLAFSSCKVTLADLPALESVHESDGRTRVKIGDDKRGRTGGSYRVEVSGTASVCQGFAGEAVPAQKLAALDKGAELTIPVRRTPGRAFVGILSWPLAAGEDEGNMRAALKALVAAFEAGASEGRFLWGAIYAPDGKRLVASETADYTPMEVFTPEKLARFKAGSGALGYEEVVKRVLADVADLEGTVDLMVVASGAEGACKWANPFASAATRGGRSALVRVIKAAPGLSSDPTARARMCDVSGNKDAVGMAVEVAVDRSDALGATDRLLRDALEAAAKSLAAPPPETEAPPKAKKAEAEPVAPPPSHKVASVVPVPDPVGKPAAAGDYQDRYELPEIYRPLAAAYLAAPYAGAISGPVGTFRIGTQPPAASLMVRFVKRADGAPPWEGIPIGLFRGDSGKLNTRLTVTDGALSLGGSTALHPVLYAFMPETRPVVGFKLVTFESDTGRKGADGFSVLSDTAFLLKAYLDAPYLGDFDDLCVNKRTAAPVCAGNAGEVVEDPLSGGPALLMVSPLGLPKWLAAVTTEICVEGSVTAPPKLAVPVATGKHADIELARQGERWCSPATRLDYALVREEGILIGSEAPRRRLDARLAKGTGAWTLRASAPRQGPGGWVHQLVLAPSV